MTARTFIFLGALLPAVAMAQTLPRFDVDKHCEKVSQFGGGSHTIFNSCIQLEQGSYDSIRSRWDGVSPRIRRHCSEVGAFGGGSYQILESCVTMEEDAAGGRKTFKP
jgi:hypothetical protein